MIFRNIIASLHYCGGGEPNFVPTGSNFRREVVVRTAKPSKVGDIQEPIEVDDKLNDKDYIFVADPCGSSQGGTS